MIYHLSSPSIILLPIVFWPFALISLVFDTANLNIGFFIYLIYYLSSPSIILLPIIFWPFVLISPLVFDSEPQHRISDLFGLLSIVSLHCPSTHHLLAFCLLLVFDSASLNLFLIYLIYSLSSLSSSFYHHPFVACI